MPHIYDGYEVARKLCSHDPHCSHDLHSYAGELLVHGPILKQECRILAQFRGDSQTEDYAWLSPFPFATNEPLECRAIVPAGMLPMLDENDKDYTGALISLLKQPIDSTHAYYQFSLLVMMLSHYGEPSYRV